MAQEFRTRPSVLLGLDEDPYYAWCFDEATWSFGAMLEAEMSEAERGKTQDTERAMARQSVLNRMLAPTEEEERREGKQKRFADPATMFKSKGKKEVSR